MAARDGDSHPFRQPSDGCHDADDRFPTAIHIPKHTNEKSEIHIVLRGSHLFENRDTGERFDIQQNGPLYLPGRIVHEAWVPAGSRAIMVLEDGWKVNWLDGPPPPTPQTVKDIHKGTPPG